MIVAVIFLYLLCGSATLTSATIYGVAIDAGEEWWTNRNIFLKFYSPSGRNYFIDSVAGEISLEYSESMQESTNYVTSPYISFVAVNLKVYDIFFERDDLHNNMLPRIVDSAFLSPVLMDYSIPAHYVKRIDIKLTKFGTIDHFVQKQVDFEDKTTFVRHSLHSFVGPDKQIYTLNYDSKSDITIASEKPEKTLTHIEIKTFGPYAKWERTYSFSDDGDMATDLTLSPVEMTTNRFIPLAEMEANPLIEQSRLFADFNTPSGNRYLITRDIINLSNLDNLNIAREQHQPERTDEYYITFIEPNHIVYGISFQEHGSNYVAKLVALKKDEYIGRQRTKNLLSFVGPDKKTYRINHRTENNEEVPVLDVSPTTSSDFRVTFVITNDYYKNYIHFIFSNEGKELFDRVDEYDFTPLEEMPALPAVEVDVDGDFAKSSFLTFYSPSGRIYYLTPDDGEAKFVVAKVSNNNPGSPYISFPLADGRTSNIYYEPNGAVEMKFTPADGTNSSTTNWPLSFVTPDQQFHKISTVFENDVKIPFIDITAQARDPLDKMHEDCLRIVISNNIRDYHYLFTWNGDKLIKGKSFPHKRVHTAVLKSLIGK